MTEHRPGDAFGDIVAHFRDEMIDPIAEPLLHRVREYVEQLDGMAVTKAEAKRIQDELNNMVSELDPDAGDVFVRVSGKMRLHGNTSTRVLGDSRRTPHLHALQPGITERFDTDGSYYPVHRQLCSLDSIAVEPSGEWLSGTAEHRISYRLTLSIYDYDEYADGNEYFEDEATPQLSEYAFSDTDAPKDDNTSVDVIMYATDVETLERSDATNERIARDIRKYFPEVARQLDSITHDPYDDMVAVRFVKDLDLVFDWSNSPYHEKQERKAVIDAVSNIIVEKLSLDNSMYNITYQGLIAGIQPDGSRVLQLEESRRDMNGIIIGTMLEKIEDEAANPDTDEYFVSVFVSASAYGRERGDVLITMPVASIFGLTNLRNQPIFAMPTRDGDAALTPRRMEFFAPRSTPPPVSPEVAVAPEGAPKHPEPLTEAELERYASGLAGLRKVSEQYRDRRFTTREKAIEAQTYLTALYQDFFDRHPRLQELHAHAQGEFIEFIGPHRTGNLIVSQAPFSLELTDNTLKRGDYATTRTGMFLPVVEVVIEEHVQNGNETYSVHPYLFVGLDRMKGRTFSQVEGASFTRALYKFDYLVTQEFALRMTESGSIAIAELDRVQKLHEIIGDIVDTAPDETSLLTYLQDILQEVERERPDAMIALSTENFHGVSERATKNRRVSSLAADALANILGERYVRIRSVSYGDDGETKELTLHNRLVSVLDAAPNNSASGPVLVIDHDDTLHYVPISTITDLEL